MTWRTHLAGGMASLWLLQPFLPQWANFGVTDPLPGTNLGVLALLAGLGALLPDLDARESKAKHLAVGFSLGGNRFHLAPFHVPATLLHRTLGHRGPLHSLLGLLVAAVVIGLPLARFVSVPAAVALLLGWASHLALDACTKTGVPLLWPDKRRICLLPAWLRVTTGSDAEGIAFALLSAATLALLLTALPIFAVNAAPW